MFDEFAGLSRLPRSPVGRVRSRVPMWSKQLAAKGHPALLMFPARRSDLLPG